MYDYIIFNANYPNNDSLNYPYGQQTNVSLERTSHDLEHDRDLLIMKVIGNQESERSPISHS